MARTPKSASDTVRAADARANRAAKADADKADAAIDTKAPVAETAAEETTAAVDNNEPITVMDELLDAVNTQDAKFAAQSAKEDDKTYLTRLITSLSEIPDDVFDTLPKGAQDWYNETGTALTAGDPIKNPEGFVSKFGVKSAKPAAAAKEPKAAKAPPPPRPPGITLAVRKLICEKPDMSLEDLKKALVAKGLVIKDATSSTIRSDVLATINAAKSVGRWKD